MTPADDKPARIGQLALALPHPESTAAEDFVRSAANARALDFVLDWPDWPHPAAVLAGPEGCGKSHLARIWAARANACAVAAAPEAVARHLRTDRLAALVEDIDRAPIDETALFLLFNHCVESGGTILMTSRVLPARLPVALADLASRLRAATPVVIEAPDEALIEAVLTKLFADRQLDVGPQVTAFAARRMERSLAAARRLVSDVDRLSLEEGRGVTTALIARVLEPGRGDRGS